MLSAKVTAQNVQKKGTTKWGHNCLLPESVPTLHLPEKNGLNPKILSPVSASLGASR